MKNKRRNLPGLLYIISLIFFRYLGEDNSQQNYKYHKIDLEMKNWKMFDLEKNSDDACNVSDWSFEVQKKL